MRELPNETVANPSYDTLHYAAVQLLETISLNEDKFDYIVAPVRGGLLFGVIASHAFGVSLTPVQYSSRDGKGTGLHQEQLPNLPEGSRILLVDDIVDSGNTLREIVDHYNSRCVTVVTAVFHYKEGAAIVPNYAWWTIPVDSPFINYPYEV